MSPLKRITTTVRGPEDWREELQDLADRLGLTWTQTLIITSRIGRRVLDNVTLTQEQFDQLLAKD